MAPAQPRQNGEAGDNPAPDTMRPDVALVPPRSIAGRALVTVIAIMAFLSCLTAGGALLISGASEGWRDSVSREITIQVRPLPGRDLEVEARKAGDIARATPGIADVRVFTKEESARLLEPWLGTGLDLAELPVPRLIVVTRAPGGTANIAALRKELTQKVPAASVDDHRLWLERLSLMASTIEIGAVMIFALMLVAMAFAISFATRGAMAGNKDIIDVLHFVGAQDRYVAAQFQRHFLRLGLTGGLIGAGGASLIFALSGLVAAWFVATPGGDQMEALFGNFGLGIAGYVTMLGIALGIGVLTALMSRWIVHRHLQRLY